MSVSERENAVFFQCFDHRNHTSWPMWSNCSSRAALPHMQGFVGYTGPSNPAHLRCCHVPPAIDPRGEHNS
jgi:hypothetical protein